MTANNLRYFTTEAPGFLFYIWDGKTMLFSAFPDQPLEEWQDLRGETLEDLNHYFDKEGQRRFYEPGSPMYAYETNANWERLA